jgi:hypothetical protein
VIGSDLLKIRALNGSQHFAFEELSCQLASLEPREIGETFLRKGIGSDAGVECYLIHKDGKETGWQAKFFDCFGSGQISQLTESVQQAIKKHPKLKRYIVCLPIDLKDGRTGKNKTEGQRWVDWKTDRLAELGEARQVEIELWQATNIRERLQRNDPYYAGRLAYFFDETHFSNDWFKQKVSLTCDVLGSRYTPQFHVTLPIRQAFLGIGRDPWLEEQREDLNVTLVKQSRSVRSSLEKSDISNTELHNFFDTYENLLEGLNKAFLLPNSYPLVDWQLQIEQLQTDVSRFERHFWQLVIDEKNDAKKNDRDVTINALDKLSQTLHDIHQKLNSNIWLLANKQAVMVYGEAGSGKSHLLADVANDTLKKGYPAVFLMSSQFFQQDPRTQILEQLDLRHISFATFLGSLDAAGQASGVRTLIIIDALNERFGIEIWQQYLGVLINEVTRYPHLALIVSCRSTYLPFILPADSKLTDHLSRIEHRGFADGGGYAAHKYLAVRKIVRPSVPNLLPEFNNPLFLKTLCDSLDAQGLKEFPRGIRGLTQYFQFYLKALTEKIELRRNLDKRQMIVQRAINSFTDKLLLNQSSYLPLEATIACLESILLSQGQADRSLLSQLEHEGILTIEPVYIGKEQLEEQVRFTFERFSDFQIAEHLLNQHLSIDNTLDTLNVGTPLHAFLSRRDIYRVAGIVEALAVLLPERTIYELPNILSTIENLDNWIFDEAFLKSLLLRRQDRFTEKTREHIVALSSGYQNHWLETLIAISTEPDNIFNADYLHKNLVLLTMPERDTGWSIDIAELSLDEGSPLDILLTWAVESGFEEIDPERTDLAATTLTWLFSTSHRTIRDKATKGLSALLAPRLPLAITLLEKFRQVDDLYIKERLLAACYGAALQAKTQKNLGALALYVYQWIFADGKPPTHLLLRDYARGIIEYALHCGLLPTEISIDKARPPYQSQWPIEFISENDLAKYGEKYRDLIVRSASSEWLGDFAKYIISPAIHYWTTTSLESDIGLTPQQNYENFCSWLIKEASCQQISAFNEMVEFCLTRTEAEQHLKNDHLYTETENSEIKVNFVTPKDEYWQFKKENDAKFEVLESKFIDLLDDEYRYKYWTGCRQGIMQITNQYLSNQPEKFNDLLSQRWITKRTHDFGWEQNLFGEFDDRIGSGRGRRNKHIERIGKKYQWLALCELLARMADNLMYHSGYSDDTNKYNGPWQIGKRDIDPSLLIKQTQDDGWKKHPAVWWSPQTLKLRQLNREQQKLWLHNEDEQLNSPALIDVTESETQQHWLVLKSFKHYSNSHDSGLSTDSWCRIWCVVVNKQHKNQFINAIAEHDLIDPYALPKIGEFYGNFIGEYPWHPSYELADDWRTLEHKNYGFRYKVLPTFAEYHAETGVRDYSIEGNISAYLPAPWLINKLGLRLIDGHKMHYADNTGRTLFQDPSVHLEGPTAALIEKTAFLDLLIKENLAPVWIIAGEKGAYGEHDNDFVGRRVHTFVYSLDNNNEIKCVKRKIDIQER